MKRLLLTGLMAAAVMIATVAKAEAITSLQVRVCQGATCTTFAAVPGPGPDTHNNVTVGDYTVSVSVSSLENILASNAITSNTSITRNAVTSGAVLEVWLVASSYNNPPPPGYDITSVLSANGSLAPAASTVTYQGWVNFTNSNLFVGSGTTPGQQTCNLGVDTTSCPSAALSTQTAAGATPFSIITLTTFTVPTASVIATYTTSGQINILPIPVPEPASMVLLGSGLVGLAVAARRRRRS